jgi:hypothetical protein
VHLAWLVFLIPINIEKIGTLLAHKRRFPIARIIFALRLLYFENFGSASKAVSFAGANVVGCSIISKSRDIGPTGGAANGIPAKQKPLFASV